MIQLRQDNSKTKWRPVVSQILNTEQKTVTRTMNKNIIQRRIQYNAGNHPVERDKHNVNMNAVSRGTPEKEEDHR